MAVKLPAAEHTVSHVPACGTANPCPEATTDKKVISIWFKRLKNRKSHTSGSVILIAGTRLKIADKILLHMSRFERPIDNYNAPESLTQDGIANAVSKTRSHVSIELSALEMEGLIERQLMHYKGASKKKQVFSLTAKGRTAAAQLTDHLKEKNIEISDVIHMQPLSVSKQSGNSVHTRNAKASIAQSFESLEAGKNGMAIRKLTKAIDDITKEMEGSK